MLTPFGDDDRIDFRLLANEARFLKQSGVTGMVVGGSMGEGAGLSEQEIAEAVRVVIEAVDGTLPVLAGLIADSSAEAVRLAKAARQAGACGLQVPPPHFRPTADTPILAEYYRSITDGAELLWTSKPCPRIGGAYVVRSNVKTNPRTTAMVLLELKQLL